MPATRTVPRPSVVTRRRGALPVPQLLCVVVLAALAPLAGASAQKPDPTSSVFLELRHPERRVEVAVNGVPAIGASAETSTLFFQAAAFLVDGANSLTVDWTAVSRPPIPMEVRLLDWPRGTDRSEATVLVADTVPFEGPLDEARSRTWSFRVTLERPLPWHRAGVVDELGRADRERIRMHVAALHRELDSGNVDAFSDRARVLFRTMGVGDSARAARIEARYREMADGEGWGLEPLDPAGVRIEAHGRLVGVEAPEGPVLRSTPDGDGRRITMDRLFYAKIDGRWTLVAGA